MRCYHVMPLSCMLDPFLHRFLDLQTMHHRSITSSSLTLLPATASQSTTDLPNNQTRRPLFGVIMAMSPGNPDLGYGISSNTRRRRGSEGSMHSPNPVFPQEQGRPEISPSSPTAWYLGATLGD